MVNISLNSIQRWLWPGDCLLCTARVPYGKDICDACERSLPRPQGGCPRCGAHMAISGIKTNACGECQKHPPAYAYARAAFRYTTPVDRLVQGLKYHHRLDLSRVLGHYLAKHIQTLNDPLPDVIVPVPLHPARLRDRGYNQSLEIARPVARQLQRPLNWRDVRRVRPTPPQTELPREKRRRNVLGAFKANESFTGQHIALIDDVMTTGHTANALAETLLRSGAREVRVWVVARA